MVTYGVSTLFLVCVIESGGSKKAKPKKKKKKARPKTKKQNKRGDK